MKDYFIFETERASEHMGGAGKGGGGTERIPSRLHTISMEFDGAVGGRLEPMNHEIMT